MMWRHSKEIELDLISFADLELIGIGAYSPIEGFFNEKITYLLSKTCVFLPALSGPFQSHFRSMRKATELSVGETVKLTYEGETYGVIQIEDLYVPDKQKKLSMCTKRMSRSIRVLKSCSAAAIHMSADRSH